MRSTTRKTVEKARTLRREMSQPEARLWQLLRTRPGGLKFRRQHPIGPYVLDFYCPTAKLAIEVDGDVHGMGDTPERDERRDRWLQDRGLHVLRIPAEHLFGDIEPVIRLIISRCSDSPSTALRAVPLPIASRQGGLD